MDAPISYADICAAQQRIAGYAVRTPFLNSPALDERVGAKVFLKTENLQRGGSFKFRGAFNRLSQLTPDQKSAGCVAWSSGNHAQGIAAAAQILGLDAAIVMPSDAPVVKVEKTRSYGAEIIFYDRYTQSREEIGARLAKERGAVLVPSYDDRDIITGQATVGAEILEQASAMEAHIDALLCCCGGGGLIAGVASAFHHGSPQTLLYSVEPDTFDDHKRSLETGQRVTNDPSAKSICDALLAPTPGALTYPINEQLLAGGLSVSDGDVLRAMRFAFDALKLVVEPGGAVALAALLNGKVEVKGKTVAVVLSGGNVDTSLFQKALDV